MPLGWRHFEHTPAMLNILSDARGNALSEGFNAMASEVLPAIPIAAYCAETVVKRSGHLRKELASLKAVHAALMWAHTAKLCECPSQQLQAALREHLQCFSRACGPEWVRPHTTLPATCRNNSRKGQDAS